ncbi:hypothetical protein [Paenibacillus faecalis]|uniref:hypothetical protein n=1 Tax=Paenibacillus faecalis TaxID=2079532 RepID=UPI000D0EE5A1|nr:hypothetical protein [Paenibacillus faecalis]
MEKYRVEFHNYFTDVSSVDIILFMENDQMCFPLAYDEDQNVWSTTLLEKPEIYQLGLNNMFPINQLKTKYLKVDNQTFSIYETNKNCMDKVEVLECYLFTTDSLNKVNKRSIFYFSDQIIVVAIKFHYICSSLIATEWINPEGRLVYAVDSYVEEEQEHQSFFILNQNYLTEGLWSINIYADGNKIANKSFYLRKISNKYIT